ncbi:MAG TPA: 2-dehydropantoate 2-reductase [Anaeromyxobacteraceae bacterium]|nr:2-dehydropantoate 2-reductase [Anaeromyxobacteraceae bacterium]
MRICFVGAGGVGLVFGGLAAHGHEDVSFLARGRALEALRSRGLRVHGPFGLRESRPFASDSPAELAARGPFDAVVVAVKAWQVRELAPTLRPLVGDGTVVVPLENGVEAAEQLAAALGEGPVAGGLCHVFAWTEEPGTARTTGTPLRITLGERGGGTSPRLQRLAEALRRGGIEVVVADDVQAALWEKFLFIDPFGSVGAVTRSPVGAFRSLPESRALLVAALEEVAALALARGARIHPEAVARTLARLDELPAEATASMQRDVAAGRPSELEDQTGAVVRLAAAAGVPAPVHRFLLAALLPQERAARAAAVR